MNNAIEYFSYQQIWDAYCVGMVSTSSLAEAMRKDEVFAAWCKRKVREIRKQVEQANGKAEADEA